MCGNDVRRESNTIESMVDALSIAAWHRSSAFHPLGQTGTVGCVGQERTGEGRAREAGGGGVGIGCGGECPGTRFSLAHQRT